MSPSFLLVEGCCVAVLCLYLVAHRRTPRLLEEAAIISVAGCLGEDSMIRLYGFYSYAPGWHLFLDRVPLLIPAIWAPVVLSARAIAEALGQRLPRLAATGPRALVVGGLVLFDALLIEPIAVHAGLWSWTEPGIFAVPLIGVLGWGLFASAMSLLLDGLPRRRRLWAVPLGILATHLGLLIAWWGALRWGLRDELPLGPPLVLLAALSAGWTVLYWRAGLRLPGHELGPRAAATAIFAGLVGAHFTLPLGAWALVCTPPWLLLTARLLLPGAASVGLQPRGGAEPAP